MKLTHGAGLIAGLVCVASLPVVAQKPRDPSAPLTRPSETPNPSIVCGMKVFSGRSPDSKMAIQAPPQMLFPMRVVRGSACREYSRRVSPNTTTDDFLKRAPQFLPPKK